MIRRLFYLTTVFLITAGTSLVACPGCRDATTQAVNNKMADVQAGFSWSVLFLMAMPISLISAFVIWVVKLEKDRNNSK